MGHRCVGLVILGMALVAGSAPVVAGSAGRVEHLVPATTAEVGRTRVIAFRVASATDEARRLEAVAGADERIAVVRPAEVAAGHTLGYVRIRGLAEGRTTLAIAGVPLDVDVVASRGVDLDATPRITGPAAGAVVWGGISIGVELSATPDDTWPTVVVRSGGGQELDAVADTDARFRPHRQLRFELDASRLPPGPLTLTPVAIDADGRETAGVPITVRNVHPAEGDIVEGEAETRYDVERPERFPDGRMSVGRHDEASGGAYFSNAGAQPAVCFPLQVDEAGWYQVVLRAGGSRAGGALPTVGIVVDGGQESVTNGRVLDQDWHRFAAGIPFRLDAGEHVITPLFANDFYVPNLADRNLALDRIEIVRVTPVAGATSRPQATSAPARVERRVGDPLGLDPAPLRLAFARPLHGQVLPGLIEIEGRVWWANPQRDRAPIVTLLVNDRPVLTQRAGAPLFWVDANAFTPGANRIALRAETDEGIVAETPTQVMTWPEDVGAPTPPRRHWRFSVHDERWAPETRERLAVRRHPKERVSIVFSSEGTARLELPEAAEGRFDVYLEAFGEAFEGRPRAVVTLHTEPMSVPVGETDVPSWWAMSRVDTVELPWGPKSLDVAFVNDKFEAGRGDRNLLLQSLILVQLPENEDRVAPVARITWPPERHPTHGVDAVVVEVSDNASMASADLLLDGVDTGQRINLNRHPGRLVFPLLLRGVEPGEHRITVRATDVTGNSCLSAPRTVRVLDATPPEGTAYARAVKRLRRFAYGADPDELAAILTMGSNAWLADRLARPLADPGDLAALGTGFTYFAGTSNGEVPQRAVSHCMLTPNPVRARFAHWAGNHFSTWIRKIEGDRKWAEHVAFLEAGPTTFDRLLWLSATSPAMLAYLDQDTSFAGRLNENYAREILELHTLGVDGGYDQDDVEALARLLTGWTAPMEGDGRGGGRDARTWSHRFDPALNDGDAREVIGLRFETTPASGRYDRIAIILETLAAHPDTARFISRKLAEHYVSVPAPDDLVDDLVIRYLETGGDLAAMITAIASHPEFEASPARVATPLDASVTLIRTSRHYHPWRVTDFLRRSGHGVFDRSSPDGYPEEDAEYVSSNVMIQRWTLARDFQWHLAGIVPNAWRYGNDLDEATWATRVVDVYAVRLTGGLLSPASHEAALQLLAATSGNRDERVRALGPFITQLPESGLR